MNGTSKLKVYTDYTTNNPSIKENWNCRRRQGYNEYFKRTDNFKDHHRRKETKNNSEEK